ncbi:MAG: hypothetical protein QW705_04930 [Zestosphaera sp.]
MPVLDVRCRDVARILAEGPKTRKEVGVKLRKEYPSLRPRGSWVRDVLLRWNPLAANVGDDVWGLSDLGNTFTKLPGELGKPLTTEEKAFLLGLMLLDEKQGRVVSELLTLGRSSNPDRWLVTQTRRVLISVGLLKPE